MVPASPVVSVALGAWGALGAPVEAGREVLNRRLARGPPW